MTAFDFCRISHPKTLASLLARDLKHLLPVYLLPIPSRYARRTEAGALFMNKGIA